MHPRPAYDPPVTTTKDRILLELKTRGKKDAAALARRLEVTTVAIRQHLAALEAAGLVTATDERRPVGRPARMFDLTDAAAKRFPQGYADLAVDMIDSVRAAFGDEGLSRLVEERTQRQLRGYRERLPAPSSPLGQRVAALARIRRDEGYMAESRKDGDGYLLIENHCPICAAAQVCTRLCDGEEELFRGSLGRVRIERTEHLLDGARRCVYRISPS
ncbi:MAG: transcriptional regulator [Planctomycetes bacterium]|nr:transcriptional regulator [Planctomycetota bacterium]